MTTTIGNMARVNFEGMLLGFFAGSVEAGATAVDDIALDDNQGTAWLLGSFAAGFRWGVQPSHGGEQLDLDQPVRAGPGGGIFPVGKDP